MACRPARSLTALRTEIRNQFPRRDEASDGGCASADHSARSPNSDHEPNAAGVARAYDYDEDLYGAGDGQGGLAMMRIAEHLRRLGEYGDHRLVGGTKNGYLIYEARIAGAGKGWQWRPYTGPNAHKHHLHVSVCSNPAGYDDDATPWHITDQFTPPPTPPSTQEDDVLRIVQCRDHPAKGEFLTNCVNTVRTLTPAALQHGRNLGYYPASTDQVPHDWLQWVDQVQDSHHNPGDI